MFHIQFNEEQRCRLVFALSRAKCEDDALVYGLCDLYRFKCNEYTFTITEPQRVMLIDALAAVGMTNDGDDEFDLLLGMFTHMPEHQKGEPDDMIHALHM